MFPLQSFSKRKGPPVAPKPASKAKNLAALLAHSAAEIVAKRKESVQRLESVDLKIQVEPPQQQVSE